VTNYHPPLKDLYSVLGVGSHAGLRDIRKAFRELAQAIHPDRNPSAEAKQKFQEIGEAYRTLKDEKKRKEYDARVISQYCKSFVGTYSKEDDKRKKAMKSELHRLLGK